MNGVMKTKSQSKMGVRIIAGGLCFVGGASAIDLIQNGSFESITGGTPQYGGITDGTAPGWNGVVSTLPYSGTVYFAGPAVPASESPGNYYSWRHQSAVNAYSMFVTPADAPILTYALTQTLNLTNAFSAADIDAGRGNYTLSAWL